MSGVICEPRIAVMILVKASWENETGVLQNVPARIEDRSSVGACLRLKARVGVGSKLNIQGRNEQFSGIARYCRRDGMDYVVGVQRQAVLSPITTETASMATPEQEDPNPGKGSEELNESTAPKIVMGSVAAQEMKPSPLVQIANCALALPGALRPVVSQPQHLHVHQYPKPQINQVPDKAGTSKLRKPMRKKLLDLAHWSHDKRAAAAGTNGNGDSADEKRNLVPQSDSHPAVKESATSHVDLLPMDEIFDELRQDAIARQAALDSYENEQRIRVEAEWARKAEENVQIEAELERIKTHYMARIGRNKDGVSREKAAFGSWLEGKQHVSQNIAEAVELCLSPMVSQPVAGPVLEISKASAKTM